MKRSNLITAIFFIIVIAGILFLKGTNGKSSLDDSKDEIMTVVNVMETTAQVENEKQSETTERSQNEKQSETTERFQNEKQSKTTERVQNEKQSETTERSQNEKQSKTTVKSEESLFIGDSRTLGLMEYSNIKSADFYANTGMTVYNIRSKKVSVPNIGKIGIDELLMKKSYDKVYVMLGINEVGYDFNQTVNEYKSLIKYIQKKQPDAVIFIQANLHVTKSRSDSDKVINNRAINRFNNEISKMADGKKIFYIDANVLFDDGKGNLSEDKSADTAHPYAKYYAEWGEWIKAASESLLLEGKN